MIPYFRVIAFHKQLLLGIFMPELIEFIDLKIRIK